MDFKNDLRVSCSKCSCLLKNRAREWQMFPLLCNVGRTATWRFLINCCWVFDRRRNPCKIPNWYILSCGVFSLPPTAARRLNTGSSLVCEHRGSPSNDGILKNLTGVNKYISHYTWKKLQPKKRYSDVLLIIKTYWGGLLLCDITEVYSFSAEQMFPVVSSDNRRTVARSLSERKLKKSCPDKLDLREVRHYIVYLIMTI